MTHEPIGFLGAGLLGTPIAANLLEAGYPVRIYNRTRAKLDPLVARGARAEVRPADVASPGGIGLSVLWNGAAIDDVATPELFSAALRPPCESHADCEGLAKSGGGEQLAGLVGQPPGQRRRGLG